MRNVRGFVILPPGGGLTSFNKDNSHCAYFPAEKNHSESKLSGVPIF